MKKRIFGILLMGAMVVASMSMFTSCKDYDDDINNLQKQIDGITAQNLQSQLTTLQTALSAAQNAASTAQSAADAAAKAAQAAQGTADAANTAAKAAQATADAAAKAQDVKDLQSAIDDLKKIIDGKVSSEDLANAVKDLEAKIAAINEGLLTLDDVKKLLADQGFASDAVVKDLSSQIAALKAYKAALEKAGITEASVADQIAKINAAITTLNAMTAEGGDLAAIKELANKASETANGVTDKINLLNVLVDKMLNSLVTIPSFYWGGIEAIEAPILTYDALKYTSAYNNAAKKNFDTSDATYATLKANAHWSDELVYVDNMTGKSARNLTPAQKKYTVDIIPEFFAEYHVNPATLTKEDIEKVEVISADKKYYTRAAASAPTVKSFDVNSGKMTVGLDLIWAKIAKGTDVTVIAVQATGAKKDTEDKVRVVTSDYAAIAPSLINNIAIVDNSPANNYVNQGDYYRTWNCGIGNAAINYNPQHVYTNITKAIDNNPTHYIKWNSEGLDLNTIVEVHANRVLQTSAAAGANEMNLTPDLAKFGLELKYSLVSWINGTYKTEQTVNHATLEGSILKPKGINGEQSQSSVGRQPLVKIELVDTNNGNALAVVGYIKFEISKTEATTKQINVSLGEIEAYKVCNGFSKSTTWDEVESKILSYEEVQENGISKVDFENSYRFAASDNSELPLLKTAYTPAQKLKVATFIKNGDAWVKAANAYNAAVSYTTEDFADKQTNVLKLTVSYELAKYILAVKNPNFAEDGKEFLDAAGKATNNLNDAALNETASVTLGAQLKGSNGLPNIYVSWDVTVNQLMLAINKIPEYWFAANNEVATSGVAEIHVNVNPVGQASADIKNFAGDLRKTIVNTAITSATAAAPTIALKTSDPAKALIPATGKSIDNTIRGYLTNNLSFTLAFVGGSSSLKLGGDEKSGDIVTGGSGQNYFMYPADATTLVAIPVNAKGQPVALAAASVAKFTAWPAAADLAKIKVATISNYEFQLYGHQVADISGTNYYIVKDILNYSGAKSLANTLTAHVKASVAEVNGTCINPVILENPTFDVKFLRPLNASGASDATFTDAVDNGNTLYLKNLATFVDWRNSWIPVTYHQFYDVKSLTPVLADITTTLNNGTLGTTKLSDVAPNTKFNYYANKGVVPAGIPYDMSKACVKYVAADATATPPVAEQKYLDLGILYYPNIDVNVGDFSIQVPLEVTYWWGTLRGVNVKIDVKYTKNNGGSTNP